MSQELRNRVIAKLQEGINLASQHFNRKFSMPSIDWSLSGNVAGQARWSRWQVRINEGYLRDPRYTEDMIINTTPHELAHLLAFELFPQDRMRSGRGGKREVHGENWKLVMRVLGVPEHLITRCHSYERQSARRMKSGSEQVVCSVCSKTYIVGQQRARQLRTAPLSLWCKCRAIGSRLLFVNDQNTQVPAVPVKAPSNILKELEAVIMGNKPPVVEAVVHQTSAAPKVNTGSKIDRCWELYKRNPTASRSMMISTFVSVAGCTTAGAGTYYATCKKRYENGVM